MPFECTLIRCLALSFAFWKREITRVLPAPVYPHNGRIISYRSLIFCLPAYDACPVHVINFSDTFSTTRTLIWGRRNALVPTTPDARPLVKYTRLFSAVAFPRSPEIHTPTGKRLHPPLSRPEAAGDRASVPFRCLDPQLHPESHSHIDRYLRSRLI